MSISQMGANGLSEIPVRGGLNKEEIKRLESLIDENKRAIEEIKSLRADLENYGFVKLSDLESVTNSEGIALSASEKNATVAGTLAYKIENLKRNLAQTAIRGSVSAQPWVAIKENWSGLKTGTYLIRVDCGTVNSALIQKIDATLGSAIIFGYGGLWFCTFLGGKWNKYNISRDGTTEF